MSARRTAWMILRRPDELTASERTALEQLGQICPDVRVLHPLTQDFAQRLRERRAADLDPWLERTATSGVPELKRLAEGLQRDHDAVQAALSWSHSSGQVDGQLTKLKLLKRSRVRRVTQRSIAPSGSQE